MTGSLDFSSLGDLAKQSPVKRAAGWQPPTIDDLGDGSVLFFDQSLTATGWVLVAKHLDRLVVMEAGKMKCGHGELGRGVEQDLRRAVDVWREASNLIYRAWSHGFAIVHESPPHAGNVKGGGTSSLMTATSIRIAAAAIGAEITMLGAQPAKKLVCGSTKATKTEAHAALKLHCFPWIEGTDLVTNEATRDALMGALLWLARKKH